MNPPRILKSKDQPPDAQSLLAAIFATSQDAIYSKTLDGIVTSWNSAAERIYGYTAGEMIGHSIERIIPPGLKGEFAEMMSKIEAGESVACYETERIAKNGDRLYISLTLSPLYDQSGNVNGALVIARDITAYKTTAERLERCQHMVANLMDTLPGMAYRCANDRYWSMQFVSLGCKDLTGYETEDLIGNRKIAFADLIHPDDRQAIWDEVQKALAADQPYQIEYRITTADGKEKWVWEQGAGLSFDDSAPAALQGFITDITDRKLAEEALRESNERFLTVVDSIDAHVYVADMQTHEILLMNEKMRADFGGDFSGQVCWRVFRNEMGPCPYCTNRQLLDAGGNPTGVVTWESLNPVTGHWYLNHDRAIKWVDGRLVRLQIATDITVIKQAEERLKYLSNHDTLTGLYNRLYLNEEIKRLENSRLFPISVLMLDIDDLKQANDHHGHAAGDELLCQAAEVLRSVFRVEDIIARVGGDEFVVLLPRTQAQVAKVMMQRVRQALASKSQIDFNGTLNFSMGVVSGDKGCSIQELLKQADRQMYLDKSSKKFPR